MSSGAASALAQAWALKEHCYEAWAREPARALRAAQDLQDLRQAGVPPAQAGEVGALADWTAGIACVTRGEMAEAVAAFDRAQAGLRQAGQPDAAAQTQVPKIMALSMLGRHDEAVACAESAQGELRALGNLAAAARVSQNLGGLQLRRDAYAEAARHYREAAVLFARLGERRQSVLADIGLADALAATGDFDEALRIYARARMRAERQALEPLLALVDESVALVDLARGGWRAALAGLESARRRYEALQMPQQAAIAEKQLGDAYLELHLLPEALALFAGAVARFRELELPDEQAWALLQAGRAQALLRGSGADAGLADAALAEAGTLFTAQGNAVGGAAVALSRAERALAVGQAGAALAAATQAVDAYARAAQADGRARAELLQAQALLQAGRVAEAGAAFDATLVTAQAQGRLSLRLRCLGGQGQVALAQGDIATARARFEAAIAGFEEQRRALPGDDLRSAFLGEHLRPYEALLRMALAGHGDGPGGEGAQVLLQLDRFRARALDDRLAEGAPATAPDDTALALRERLNWLYRRMQRLHDEGGSSAVLSAELLDTEQALLERARRQRLAAPARAPGEGESEGEGEGEGEAFSVAALQAALGDGEALVAYGVLDDELFACVATRDGVQLQRRLAAWPAVLDALRSTRLQLETLGHGASYLPSHLATLTARAQARLARMHALVWAPLQAALAGAHRVLLVPHGPLAELPFAALPAGEDWLGQQLALALVPSARAALRGLRRPPAPARRVLALGESSRLPHAGREATQVAGLFDAARVFVGEAATLQALRDHAGSADVLHLACHAQFRSDNPRYSALHLHDQALTAEDAETLNLPASTVVLSACESALAEAGSGDEQIGLVRAFLVAGAARVVASLWPVDDAVTAVFMARFYRALRQGQGAAAALAAAQSATQREHAHPSFWAAFTLHGGW